MVRVKICDYTGEKIEPGTGIMYVKKDGTVLNFKNKKAEKLYLKGVDPREQEWTQTAREYKKNGDSQDSIVDRVLEREQLEKPDEVATTGGDVYFMRLYQEYLDQGGFSDEDVDNWIENAEEFQTPGEIEHDLVRVRNDIRSGKLSEGAVRIMAKMVSQRILYNLPDDFFDGDRPDIDTFTDLLMERVSDESESA